MAKILVTGGLGFIGSHTVVELQNEGFEVVVVDNLDNSYHEVQHQIESITGQRVIFERFDLKDRFLVKKFFDKHYDLDGVIHFAANKAVGESVQNPLKYYHNNISPLVYLLDEMGKHRKNNFIFSSSCTVYGEAEELPITEDTPIVSANSPYGNTKQIGEEIIKDTCNVSTLQAIALRYFNPIGAHPSGKIGELPIGVPLNLVPYVTQTAIGLREKLLVFGEDYETPDGTPIRDYIHVVDLAKAHVVAVKRLLEDNNKEQFEIFNLGTGKGSTVLEVIKTFEKVNDISVNYEIVERRSGDVTAAYADTTKANKELGWKTELSLADALKDAWNWEKIVRSDNVIEEHHG